MRTVRPQFRSGQSLVEFAVIALVMYMLLAAIVTFGHMLYVAQGLQSAVDLAAREISRTPLLADETLETLITNGSLDAVYSKNFLVYDRSNLGTQNFFSDVVPTWPVVNQQLALMMIVDGDYIRYPGALISDSDTPTGFTIRIPLVSTSGDGGETITLVDVIEEIASPTDPDPFRVSSPSGGIVALRMNYPFQAAAMSSFRPNPDGTFEPTLGSQVATDDDSNVGSGGIYSGTHGGENGLGVQGALGQRVRPFRRLITAQAIYRREIFE